MAVPGHVAVWLGEVREKANVTPIFLKGKKVYLGNCKPVSLIMFPGKVMDGLIMENISRHMREKITRSSQHGFTEGKSHLPSDKLL